MQGTQFNQFVSSLFTVSDYKLKIKEYCKGKEESEINRLINAVEDKVSGTTNEWATVTKTQIIAYCKKRKAIELNWWLRNEAINFKWAIGFIIACVGLWVAIEKL